MEPDNFIAVVVCILVLAGCLLLISSMGRKRIFLYEDGGELALETGKIYDIQTCGILEKSLLCEQVIRVLELDGRTRVEVRFRTQVNEFTINEYQESLSNE